MKKSGVSVILSISVFSALLFVSPLMVYGDSVTLTLEGTGGKTSGGEPVYPYNISVNGSKSTISLMCISFTNEISTGESWKATITPITSKQDEEAAYIFSLAAASGATSSEIALAQWADWQLFDPGASFSVPFSVGEQNVKDLINVAAQYVKNNPNSTLYSQYEIYLAEPGTQSSGGTPQNLIGKDPSVAPEPNSMILLGSGLLLLAGILYRREHFTGESSLRTTEANLL
jgi:hypothetical protein